MKLIIDIPEEVVTKIQNGEDYRYDIHTTIAQGIPYEPKGECRTCRHRDPEDKKCDCGGQERLGCPFPVSDDYYCKYYEKGCGAE